MSDIEVRTMKPDDYPLWDELVDKSLYGTIFHTSQWQIIAGNDSKDKTEFFGAFSQNRLIGGCVIHFNHIHNFFSIATTNLPLTPYGGVVINQCESTKIREKEKVEAEIIHSLVASIKQRKPHSISLTMSPHIIDIRPYIWDGWKETVRYCYILPLTDNIEDSFSQAVRRSVKKAKKSGIVIKRKFDKKLYWDLTLDTYNKQGKQPPFSKKLLFAFIDYIQIKNCGEMWIAETSSGEVASAEIFIWDNKMAYRWSAASNDQYKELGATSFILFEMMIYLKEKGFKNINLMAANTPHLAKFISSFNPELIPYYSVGKMY